MVMTADAVGSYRALYLRTVTLHSLTEPRIQVVEVCGDSISGQNADRRLLGHILEGQGRIDGPVDLGHVKVFFSQLGNEDELLVR